MSESQQFGKPPGKPEVKGVMMPVTRVRMTARGASETVAEFREWAEALPEMMRAMPIVLDAAHHTACSSLLKVARDTGLRVIGVAEGKLAPTAPAAGLAVLADDAMMPGRVARPAGGDRREGASGEACGDGPGPAAEPVATAEAANGAASPGGDAAEAPSPESAEAATPAAARGTRVVRDPVRSGQQVYAEGADLVVLGTVSAGAEVIADGHVHVYGALRGRAIAGARGNTEARIFCQRFEAELVALAGTYDVADKMRGELRGKAVQVWLEAGSLQFSALS